MTDRQSPPKRRRTDSGNGRSSQTSIVIKDGIQREDSDTVSRGGALSPILLSDDPDLTVVESSQPGSAERPKIVLYLGKRKQLISQSRYLDHVWKYGLDSTCMVCGKDFDEPTEPPIRTFTFHATESSIISNSTDITTEPIVPHPIKVLNRHFKCLKAKRIKYVAISHVWHQEVSEAQQSQSSSAGAARLAYQIPAKSLLALWKKLGPIEVWHDYLSVPQWQREMQQQQLLRIPRNFEYPERMIMHLDDVTSADLDIAEDPPSHQAFITAISKISRSRWFERMWVTLEYIQSKEVSIMTQYFEIYETPAGEVCEITEGEVFGHMKRLGSDRFSQKARARGFSWPTGVSWGYMERWKHMSPSMRTLGSAIYIIGQKQCRDHHDYFFALRGLLGLGQDTDRLSTILADDTFRSFLGLSWDALLKGDYSPLLFTPLGGEEVDPRAPWLHGHSKMSENLWELGICHNKGKYQTIIAGGSIRPRLEAAGVLETWRYDDFSGDVENIFIRIIDCVFETGGRASEEFCETIDRIIPRGHDKAMYASDDSLGERSKSIYDHRSLQAILDRYAKLLDKGTGLAEKRRLSQKIMSIMGLNLPENKTATSRIKLAMSDAQWYGKNKEGLAKISCQFCNTSSVFRLTAWKRPKLGITKLWRIPGLLYDETVPEGTGLLVTDKEIIGRMIFGTPACDCREAEEVELGSALE